MTVVVRTARVTDVDAIVDLERAAFTHASWSVALIEEGVDRRLPTTSWWVAEHHGSFVGYAALSVVQEVAELQRLATAPESRRSGVASALLAATVAHARQAGAERVLLEVREDNDVARAFYRARGFVNLARRPSYYADGVAAIVLERAVPSEL